MCALYLHTNCFWYHIYVTCHFSLADFDTLFIFSFLHFNYHVAFCVLLFGLILSGALYFLTWKSISFSRLGKFSVSICSIMLSVPLFLLSETFIMGISVHLILSHIYLKLTSFYPFFFPVHSCYSVFYLIDSFLCII